MSAERVIANLLRIARIPADPPPAIVEATAKTIESVLLEAAERFGVDLTAIDKPATSSSPIR